MPQSIVKLDPYANTGLDFCNKLNEVIDGMTGVTAIDNPPVTPNTLYVSPYLIREIQAAGGSRHFREYNDLPDGGVKGLTANSVSEYALTFNAYYATYIFTANTTASNTTLVTSSTVALEVGDSLVGTGIPAGATISSIAGNTAVVMSTTATATASSVSITGKTWRKDSTAAGHYSYVERITESYTKEYWESTSVGTTPITFSLRSILDTITGNLRLTGTIRSQNTSNQGSITLQPGNATNTGYAEFHSATSVRQGYIGYSTTSTNDAGTLVYVSGIHSFTGNILATGTGYFKHKSLNVIGLGTPYIAGAVANEIITIAAYRQHLVYGGKFEIMSGSTLDIENNGVMIFI